MLQIPWTEPNLYKFHSSPKELLHYGDVEFVFDQEILDDMVQVYIDWKNDYEDEMVLGDYLFALYHNTNSSMRAKLRGLPHSIEVFMSADGDDLQKIQKHWDTMGELGDYVEWFYQYTPVKRQPYDSQPTSEGFMKWLHGDSE